VPNPFDLYGPEFLIFYLALGAVTLAVIAVLRRAREADTSARGMLDDYLALAYLRGGSNEAVRVATLNLINRGLIEVSDDGGLKTPDKNASQTVEKRLERAVLQTFRSRGDASALFSNPALMAAAVFECEPRLMQLGLLPDDARKEARHRLWAVAVLVLAVVAATKIAVAYTRGRSNIQFLVIEAVIFAVLAYKVVHPFRTPAGDAMLADARTLFADLKHRVRMLAPGADTHDFALLAAVFGIAAIPSRFTFVKQVFQKAFSSSSSSCGSSCGSSSSSSCGSSCGGGGCGGGCGGCGS
jgi:uncharacterized protein (TIGR04222 family)